MSTSSYLYQRPAGTPQLNETTQVRIAPDIMVGGDAVVMIAGPCAVESEVQLEAVAQTLVSVGIRCMRAGAYKPRTSPYSFQGLREEGLKMLGNIKANYPLAIVTEVLSVDQLDAVAAVADCLQIGSRNMHNFELLKAAGSVQKPVLLKRGLAATLEEFLFAAEYILKAGNPNVILCERGVRSFDPWTRNLLDLASVPLLKEMTHLPVIVDPSHSTGKRSLVVPASRAAVAIGCDGLLIESHPTPDKALCDAAQALPLDVLTSLLPSLNTVASAIGRSMS